MAGFPMIFISLRFKMVLRLLKLTHFHISVKGKPLAIPQFFTLFAKGLGNPPPRLHQAGL
jgi:hypothetical protein